MNIPNINFTGLMKNGVDALTNNAPVILTAFGAVGVAGTAVLTAKATFAAADQILQENEERVEEGEELLTPMESAKLVWPHYIAPASTGAISIAAIVMSHRISSKRAAVLAAAYALNEKKLEEYQEKIKEKFGIKKEKEARDEIAQDRVNRDWTNQNMPASTMLFSPIDGKVVLHEAHTGRFFWGTKEQVDRAINEVNAEIIKGDYIRLSEFYDYISLEHTAMSDRIGWNTHERAEIDWTVCTTPDGKYPAHSFEYVNPPIMDPGNGASFR